jgi:hypothetical protein
VRCSMPARPVRARALRVWTRSFDTALVHTQLRRL